MDLEFRDLYADEIELRVGTNKDNGFTLLLYKNARVDMALLDEVVGVGNWQREHIILGEDIYCRLGIYNEELKQWIWKTDAGAEANTEKEKSKASDSFKRAATNFGLGRCLYSAPFVWISKTTTENEKERYFVKEIDYKDHKITKLTICNEKTGALVYSYPKRANNPQNVYNEPKIDNEEPRYSIEKKTLKQIQEIVANSSQESADRFYKWLDKYYGTKNPETLTKTQGEMVLQTLAGK